jgi:hypothetical protein
MVASSALENAYEKGLGFRTQKTDQVWELAASFYTRPFHDI